MPLNCVQNQYFKTGRRKIMCRISGVKLAQITSQWPTKTSDLNSSSHQVNALLEEFVRNTLLDLFSQLPSLTPPDVSSPLCSIFSILETLNTRSPGCQQPDLTSACTTPKHWMHPCSTPALLTCTVVGPGAQAPDITSPAPWSGSVSLLLNPLLLFPFSFPCAG